MKRRALLTGTALLATPRLVTAQRRSTTILVPFAEGGSTDQMLRVFVQAASKALGQDLRLENKASRTGLRQLSQIRSAAPDGSMLMLFPVATLRALVERGVDFVIGRDATPILCLAGGTYGAIAKLDRFPLGWQSFIA
jgi:tripartite-type tricarboxylate transporter receptor subunit TctC